MSRQKYRSFFLGHKTNNLITNKIGLVIITKFMVHFMLPIGEGIWKGI